MCLGNWFGLKIPPIFWVAYLFKLRSVTWPNSSCGVMNRSIGIAGAVQFWVLDKVAFCWSWQLKEMLVKLVSVAFNVGVNQSDLNSSERRKRKHAYSFFVSMLSTCVSFLPPLLIKQVFLIFSGVFSKAAWFSAGFSEWPTIPNP